MITKHNYEEYALDYLEGKLSGVEIAAMHAFLAKYPEVREELNNFSLMPLIADENLVFGNKTALMKPANAAPKVVALPLYASYYRAVAVAAGVVLMLGAGQQVESQLIMRHYDGFMKKTRIRGRRA